MAERFVEFTGSVDDFIHDQKNKNTLNKTKQDVGLFRSFLATKLEEREVEMIDPPILNEYLSEFVVVVRQKKSGKNYEPDSLQSMFNSISRYLLEKKYLKSLMTDPEFGVARAALKSKKKELKKLGHGNKPNEADSLTKEEIKILCDQKLLGSFSAQSLTNTMWLNNMLYFGLRGCTVHRNIKWGDITLQKSNNGVEYLMYDKERQTKTRTGENSNDRRTVKPKGFMTLNRGDVGSNLIDPVEMYKLYASKRPFGMSEDESPFYLGLNIIRRIDSTKPWFVRGALGMNKLNSIMKTMASQAGLEGRFTNHSGRKTMMQTLVQNNVPPTQIIQLSGHKNLKSVNNYSHVTTAQQQNMSNMLSDLTNFDTTAREEANRPVNPSVFRPILPRSVSSQDVNTTTPAAPTPAAPTPAALTPAAPTPAAITVLQKRSAEISTQQSGDRRNCFTLSSSVPLSPVNVLQKRSLEIEKQQNGNWQSCFSLFNGAQIHGGNITINVNSPHAYKKRKSNRQIFSDSDESQ